VAIYLSSDRPIVHISQCQTYSDQPGINHLIAEGRLVRIVTGVLRKSGGGGGPGGARLRHPDGQAPLAALGGGGSGRTSRVTTGNSLTTQCSLAHQPFRDNGKTAHFSRRLQRISANAVGLN